MIDICASRDDAQPHIFRPGETKCSFCYAPGGQTKLELWEANVAGWYSTLTKGGQV